MQITMQNLELLAWKLTELSSILCFGGRFVFCRPSWFWKKLWKVNTNYHVKSGAPSSKIDWVWRPSCFLKKNCGRSICTCMPNLELLAWKLSELELIALDLPNLYRSVSESVSDDPRYRAVFTAKKAMIAASVSTLCLLRENYFLRLIWILFCE